MTYPVENAAEMTRRVLRDRWRERTRFADPFREPALRRFQVRTIRNLVAIARYPVMFAVIDRRTLSEVVRDFTLSVGMASRRS